MKIILFIPIICTLLFGKLQAQEGISLTKVEEIYTLSEINYTGEKTITLKLNSGLIIKATPVNPPELDKLFYDKSLANGQLEYREYEQSKEDYFIKKKKKKQKEEKTNSEMLLELADILLEDNKITEEQYSTLKSAVESRNASSEQVVGSNLPLLINPFYINKKYLSVYQLTIENPTTAPILFEETISILLGNNLYSRYLTQEVLELYKYDNLNNYAKVTLLLNENLPEKMEIPAGVTFSKYICTAPIKYNEGPLTLIISSANSSIKASWNIDILNSEIKKTYTYNVFDFYITSSSGVDFRESTIADGVLISLTKDSDFFLLSDKLYVNQDDMEKVIDFVALYIYMDNAYFAVAQITPKTYVDVSKQRLEDIEIETDKTDRVKRKLE